MARGRTSRAHRGAPGDEVSLFVREAARCSADPGRLGRRSRRAGSSSAAGVSWARLETTAWRRKQRRAAAVDGLVLCRQSARRCAPARRQMRSSARAAVSAQSGEEGGRDAGPAGRQSRGLERRSGLDRRCPACRPFTGRFLGRVLRDAPSREWSRRAGLSRASAAMVPLRDGLAAGAELRGQGERASFRLIRRRAVAITPAASPTTPPTMVAGRPSSTTANGAVGA